MSSKGKSGRVSLREVKAENLSVAEIYDFFVPRGAEMDAITEIKNSYIVGHKGSGKSMVLRYLSVDLQIIRTKNKKSVPFDQRAIGVFMKCNIGKFGGMVNSFSEVTSQSPWVRHFCHSFNLSAINEILKAIAMLKDNRLFGISAHEVKSFLGLLSDLLRIKFDDLTFVSAIQNIDKELGVLQEEFQDNAIAVKHRYYTDYNSLYEVQDIAKKSFSGLASMEIVLLLDEYNELGRDQQRVINEMIKIRQPIFKMSTLPYGYVNSRIDEGLQIDVDQDFDLVYLANKALTPKSGEFNSTKKFLKAVCNRRLASSGINKDVEQILEVPKHRVKRQGKRTRADIRMENEWNYCGFSNYVLLSSGNPKTILDLLQDAISSALEAGIDISTTPIPTSLQLESIQAFSKEKRDAIVNTDSKYGKSLQRFIEYAGKHLKKKSEEGIDYYRLVQIKNDERLSNFSHETIVLGLKKSWILEAEWERLADQRVRFKTLTLNNILLPSFELPFGSKQLWQIDATDVDAIMKGEFNLAPEARSQAKMSNSHSNSEESTPALPMEFYAYFDDIERLIQRDQLIVFCGAGLSAQAGYPTGQELKQRLGDELGINHKNMTLDKVAEAFAIRRGDDQLYCFLIELFEQIKNPNLELYLQLVRMGITRFVTTNWDNSLEQALRQSGISYQTIVTPTQIGLIDETKVGVFKMHGDFDHVEQMVITKKQYISYHNSHKSMKLRLESLLQNNSVLFLGYRIDDPNIRMILDNIIEQIPLAKVSYAVFENIEQHEQDRLEKDHKINVIQMDLSQFIKSLAMRLG